MFNEAIVGAALIFALQGAESDHGRNIKSYDGGKSIGILQIQNSVVKDVNRIYKTHYVHADALNANKAKVICRLYLAYWGTQYYRKTGKMPTDETLARIWNGGPNGWKVKATRRYWLARVVPHLEGIRRDLDYAS